MIKRFIPFLALASITSLFAADDLLIQDTKLGLGKEALRGTTVTVHYTGKLTNGKVFDSSVERGEPFSFDLGSGQVIQGWEKGIAGMKEGGKRKLTIPPKFGYGARAVGPIPANSTLIFDVELIRVK
ncbi:FKBP-type peptidyl-prolyl cis-trans isomerase [Leptospira ilyithenensis]|uniref:Peptidyl-prolyl cis-trans isomerase n=1 Tax=Leptospira ilyithenensis TaxID=2484901 RepID=A0A4R9LMM4_9LEPT|nr:FKBP-type peptidyl-prolyl cis-trans isomerase [Leptospira ilyithenensis]TGN08224.1 FKBP-type peptidyl-prolyl cis-trans isomerase [Leptospira ilyithenensis]